MNPLKPADINYNLSILSGKRAYPGKGRVEINAVSLEFIEILGKQIEAFKGTRDYAFLSKRVQVVGSRFYHLLESKGVVTLQDQVVPLIGKKSTPTVEINGLEFLPSKARVRRIKGDGHCLFRSIAWGSAVLKNRTKICKRLKFLKKILKKDLDIDTMLLLLESRHSAYRLLNDSKASDTFVHGMRQLACEFLRTHRKDFQPIVNSSYLANMTSMKQRAYGGELEIIALCEMLGVEITVFDISRKQQLDYKPQLSSNAERINLLFSSNHYDFLTID